MVGEQLTVTPHPVAVGAVKLNAALLQVPGSAPVLMSAGVVIVGVVDVVTTIVNEQAAELPDVSTVVQVTAFVPKPKLEPLSGEQ